MARAPCRQGQAEAMDVVHFGINKSTQPVRILAVCMGAAGAKGVIPVKQRPTRIHMPYSPPAAGGRKLELAAARVVVIASMSQYTRQFPRPPVAAARNSFSDAGQRWRE
jgi:hypothetical protein